MKNKFHRKQQGDARSSPTQSLPTILVPATEDLTTGTPPASSASSTLHATPGSEGETEHARLAGNRNKHTNENDNKLACPVSGAGGQRPTTTDL